MMCESFMFESVLMRLGSVFQIVIFLLCKKVTQLSNLTTHKQLLTARERQELPREMFLRQRPLARNRTRSLNGVLTERKYTDHSLIFARHDIPRVRLIRHFRSGHLKSRFKLVAHSKHAFIFDQVRHAEIRSS